jgi:iron(III) transport system ATP-binding protein
MPHLELSSLSKYFGTTRAVHDLTLSVERGEILSILGPSGCGKTTTLRMIAGLEQPSSGRILSNQREITETPARSRNMGMVFQNYALFPHLDVFHNVAFGLRTRGLSPESKVTERVRRALASVRMEEYASRQVQQLSGGQQQRVALARALAIEPEVLLLDEPLSNLDPSLREDLRDQMRSVIRELHMTTVFVTHDQQEALALADKVAIMEAGICRQVGSPDEVYSKPADVFVAQFLGKANIVPAEFVGVKTDGVAIVRPENIILHSSGGAGRLARVLKATFEGSVVTYQIETDGMQLISRQFHQGRTPLKPGDEVRMEIPAHGFHVIPK